MQGSFHSADNAERHEGYRYSPSIQYPNNDIVIIPPPPRMPSPPPFRPVELQAREEVQARVMAQAGKRAVARANMLARALTVALEDEGEGVSPNEVSTDKSETRTS